MICGTFFCFLFCVMMKKCFPFFERFFPTQVCVCVCVFGGSLLEQEMTKCVLVSEAAPSELVCTGGTYPPRPFFAKRRAEHYCL